MPDLLRALRAGLVLLMDGAMGTELRRAGLRPGECGEAWNLTRPERVRAVHDRYVEAGAEILLTNSFLGNPSNLTRFGLADRLEEINAHALRLARKAAGRSRFVLADVGPIGESAGGPEFADLRMVTRVLASLEGADGFLFETCSSPRALTAVRYAFHRGGAEAPLLLSLTYCRSASGDLATFSGHSPETYARHAESHGVAALGVNCGLDIRMDEIIEIIRRYRAVTDLPLFARPNAGTPTRQGERWVYPHTPEAMASRLPELLAAGVGMVGGCCGTTPEHIAAFRRMIEA